MKEIDISQSVMSEAIDVDKLDTDKTEQDKFMAIMEAERYKKNIMELSEFEREYIKLFKKDSDISDQKAYRQLSQDYLYRIDPYYPVYIVYKIDSNIVSEILRQENVVYTLPPVYNRVGMVNNLGKDGINIMQAFNNLASGEVDDRFNHKKEKYSKYLSLVLNNMNDDKAREENKAKAKALSEEVMNRSKQYKNNTFSNGPDVQDVPSDIMEELGVAESVTNEKANTIEEEEYL